MRSGRRSLEYVLVADSHHSKSSVNTVLKNRLALVKPGCSLNLLPRQNKKSCATEISVKLKKTRSWELDKIDLPINYSTLSHAHFSLPTK